MKNIKWIWLAILLFLLVASPFGCSQDEAEDKTLPLSQQERKWLADHPVIRLAPDPAYPPIEYFDENGEFKGVAADYIELISQKMGIEFEIVHLGTWDEVIGKAKSRQIDMLSAATNTPQRSEYMLFTFPYIDFPSAIIVEKSVKGTLTLEKISGMKVAVVSGYADHELIAYDYPELDFVMVQDVSTGLKEVSFGTVDAFVTQLATATYYIEKEGITNLRIAGETDYAIKLALASRNDWPELNRILAKGLAQISEKEKQAIYKKWVHLEQEPLFARRDFWIPVLGSLGVVIIVIAGILAWNRSLKHQVNEKSKELLNELTQRKQAEEDLSRLYQEVKTLNLELEEKVKERTGQLEEAVQAAEIANHAKSDFLASMSHELRTPLNAVIGFSQLLQEQYFGKLNEKQAEYVTDILESGQHLLSLINDILDLAKIEAGKMELELSKVIIKDLLGSSLIMIKEKALVHGISLDIDTTEDLENLKIMVDERRVKQVMFNLLSNAVKFTPDGGAIRVEGKKEEEEIIISVSDTGIGIAPEEQERVFEEFYQTRNTIKDKTPGTGLGLPVTKSIVKMHGGRIWVESEGPDKGSRFTFTLPD